MRPTTRMIAIVCALQVFAVLIGHACGVAGCSWLGEVYEEHPSRGPAVTWFYARHGLWLLFVPLAWFTFSMVRIKSGRRPSNGWFWLIGGAIVLLVLTLSGVGALVAVTSLPSYWHGGPLGK